ncbi:MAG: AAA family ATPase [Archaeoglobaceae archaeon]|nr:AAA family ATPase [Archaeoglobaceae archaeon]
MRHRLISTGGINEDVINRIAHVEFSDPKSIEDIGTKYRGEIPRVTYIKIGALDDIDALRIALHDPEVRVRVGEFEEIEYNQILGVEVLGSGFLGNTKIEFHPELNTLIGGRGVGKSAIIEVMRYCLDIPAYAEREYRESLIEYSLKSGGKVSLHIRRVLDKDKVKDYRVERIFGKKPIVIDLDSNEEVGISAIDIFGQKIPIIIGQREIYHISNDPQKVLQLVDEIIGESLKNESENFRRLIDALERNAKEIIYLEEKLSEKEELIQKLNKIESDIKLFEKYGLAEKLKEAIALCEDEETLKKSIEVVEGYYESLLSVFNDMESKLRPVINELKNGKSSIKGILEKVSDEIQELIENLTKYKENIDKLFQEKIETVRNLKREWDNKKKLIDEDINKIKQEMGISGDLSPDKLEELTRQKKRLNDQLDELKKFEEKLKGKINKRKNLISEVRKSRHQLFEIRRKSVERINSFLQGKLRLTVNYQAEKGEFKDSLKKTLKGSRVSDDTIEKICSKDSIDGIDISQVIENGIDEIKKEYGLTDSMARRVYSWFMEEKSRLYKLQTLFPEDSIDIELNVDGEYRQLDKLSAGQKATAILLLLFAQEDRILILDQPEEDLDNRFIYDDIVKILRKMKGKRQMIIATHNANIPVLGDSELILVLDAKEDKCCIIDEGSIDKKTIQQHVKSIMEGGEEAFRMRAEKYGDILS